MSDRHQAVLWMLGCVLGLSGMALGVRVLSGTLGVFQILFLRSILGLPLIVGALFLANGRGALTMVATRRLSLHFFRNVVHLAAQAFWVFSITVLPLATVLAIEFSAPLWAVLLAILIFAERPNPAQLIGIVLGIAGVLVIVQPWHGAMNWGMAAAVLAAMGYAANFLTTRTLGRHETTWSVLFWMALIQTPIAFVAALTSWNPIPLSATGPLLLITVCGLAAHLCMTNAFRLAPVSDVIVLDYLRLPLVAITATFLFGDPFDMLVLAGGLLVLGGIVISQRSLKKPG